MRNRTRLAVLPVAITLISMLHAPSSRLANPLDVHVRGEVLRLQAHFDSVGAEMRARGTLRLTREQRASRSQLIEWLRDYRSAATFPLNDGVSSGPVPIFRDSRGVLCAMAYLIHRSGRTDLVDDISANRNTAYVAELADDARLIAWLDSTGLTVAEAARIQPAYNPPPPTSERESGVSGGYAAASLALSGGAIAGIAVNAVSPSRMSGIFGMIAGTVALMNGVSRLDEAHDTRRLAAMNTAIGALSMGVAFRGIFAPRSSHQSIARSEGRLADVTLWPTTVASLGRPQLGLALRARF
jgi:hypothetical protein